MGSYLSGASTENQPTRSTRDNRPLTGLSPSLHTVAARADAPMHSYLKKVEQQLQYRAAQAFLVLGAGASVADCCCCCCCCRCCAVLARIRSTAVWGPDNFPARLSQPESQPHHLVRIQSSLLSTAMASDKRRWILRVRPGTPEGDGSAEQG